MAEVVFRDVEKVYSGGVVAATGIDLEVRDRELLVLVGPSGCGKSTVLRMVAGLEEVTSGEILFDGEVVTHLSPRDRDIAMVFQNYALYPHMSVHDNMAFGLKLRKFPKEEIASRVDEAARILGIDGLLGRKPKALSGGQRQRVALGRAIVRKPSVFLFDEPLSNLDAKMRVQMRTEIRKLNLQIKTTMIYVTHDQVEAMTLGDRLAVMNEGRLMQVGTPIDLYHRPANRFVAAFIGSPAMNFIDGRLVAENGTSFRTRGGDIPIREELASRAAGMSGRELTLGIRPEDLHASRRDGDGSLHPLRAAVEVSEMLGNEVILHLDCAGDTLVAREDPDMLLQPGSAIDLYFDTGKVHLFDRESGEAV